jgi:hypothetical protein
LSVEPSDLQDIFDRIAAGTNLSPADLDFLGAAIRSQQITIATGERAASIGGSADGAVVITGNGNVVISGANFEAISKLLRSLSLQGSTNSPKPGAPFPVLRLPDNFVPRPDALKAVKTKLLGTDNRSDRTLVVSAIAGLGGIGKSVLAAAVVLDAEVQERFEDGILWVTLGQNPDLLSLVGDWIRQLDKSREAFSANTLEAAKQYLGTLLAERRMLLVVDDVWNAAHGEWFRVGGADCRVLVTTREARLDGAEYYDLDLMTEDEAIELVRQKLGQRWQAEQEAEVRAFAKLLGRLPLALDLAANQVRDGLSWGELRSEFEVERRSIFHGKGCRSSALKLLDSSEAWERLDEGEQRKYSLQACFNLSLKRLSRERFEQFAWLGVLPEDVNLNVNVAAVLWEVSLLQAKKALIDLRNRSFLTSGAESIEGEPSYRVHDLMHDMARSSIESPMSQNANQLGGLGLMLPIAHGKFLERYRERVHGHRWDGLMRDGYVHRHLTWHMEQANWLDEIHALMAMSDEQGNNAWFEACDRLGQPAIFVEDVARAWKLAEQLYEKEPTRAIVLQCRYALITATLNSLVANLPISVMEKFLAQGFWSIEKAWAYVEQMQNEGDIQTAIGVLEPYLNRTLFLLAVEKARSIRDNYHRFWAFLSLSDEIGDVYFLEAVNTAQLVEHESSRASILIFLAGIDSIYLSDAVAAVRSIKDESKRISFLCHLAKIDDTYLSEIVAIAHSIDDDSSRAKILTFIAKIDDDYLSEAASVARLIKDHSSRAEALGGLAKIDSIYLSEAVSAARLITNESHYQDQSLTLSSLAEINGADFHEFLEVARSIEDESNRVSVLISLVQIDGADAAELLIEARSIEDESSRAHILVNLAKIDSACFPEAVATARSIENESNRALLLSSLAKIDSAYFPEAITTARLVRDGFYTERILISLSEIDGGNCHELLALSRSILDESSRAYFLIDLAKIDVDYFPDALSVARSIQKDSSKAHALASLAKIDVAYATEALAAARLVSDGFERVKILIRLAEVDNAYFTEAITAALLIKYDSRRARFLVDLAKIDGADLCMLLTAAHSLQYAVNQADVLISLTTVDRSHLPETVAVIRSIEHNFSRADALIDLAKIDMSYFPEALATVDLLKDESDRVKELIRMAEIDGADFSELVAATCSIEKDLNKSQVLIALARVSGADQSILLNAAYSIKDELKRTQVLSSLSEIDRDNLFVLLTAAQLDQDENRQADILMSLATIDNAYLVEALNAACSVKHEFSQAMRLEHLAEISPQSFLLKIWEKIEQIVHKPTRAEAFNRCISYFPLSEITHSYWCKYIHILAYQRRPNLIHYFDKLYPAILHLGGETAMHGVIDAMNDVCSQWK